MWLTEHKMNKGIKKEARIIKKEDKWCVVGHRRIKGEYRNFGCYDNELEAKKRLNQIYAFKHKKATILNIMTNASDFLEKKGMIHISDAIIVCAESVALETSRNDIVIKLGKIVKLLENKKENKIAEQIDILIPEILSFEKCGSDNIHKSQNRLSADKAFNIVKKLYNKYIVGLINENDYEYIKMKEFKTMLKSGFMLSSPKSIKEIPENVNSWWEYFSKRGNK
jgi:hypothetical protein